MRAKQTEEGKFEITVSVKFTFDPLMVGFDLSESDLRNEVEIALGQCAYAERAVILDEA